MIAKNNQIKHNNNCMKWAKSALTIGALGLAILASFNFFPATAFAQTPEPPIQTTDGGFSHCAVDSILASTICSLAEGFSSGTDYLFGMLSQSAGGDSQGILQIDDQLVGDSGIKSVWEVFRRLANGLFVVFALILVVSYMSGNFFSAYDVKKLLPKFLVAILLVNISYYASIILVQISNIIGENIYGLFDTAGAAAFKADATNSGKLTEITSGILLDATVGAAGAVVVGAAAASYASFKLPLLSMAVVLIAGIAMIIITTIALLAIREIVVVLAIALSPIAFVSNVLPNTESFYKLWWKFFSTALMTYPVVAALFGGSSFAGKIVASAGDTDVLMQVMAVAIQVLPLIYAPTLIRNTMAAMPMIGGQLRSIASSGIAGAKKAGGGTSMAKASRQKAQLRNAQAQLGEYRGKSITGKISNVVSGRKRFRTSGGDFKQQEARELLDRTAEQAGNRLSLPAAQAVQQAQLSGGSVDVTKLSAGDISLMRNSQLMNADGTITNQGAVASLRKLAASDRLDANQYRQSMAQLEAGGLSQSSIDRLNEEVYEKSRQNGRYDLEAAAHVHRENPNNRFSSMTDDQYKDSVKTVIGMKNANELAATSGYAFNQNRDGSNTLAQDALVERLKNDPALAKAIRDARDNSGMGVTSATNYNNTLTAAGLPLDDVTP